MQDQCRSVKTSEIIQNLQKYSLIKQMVLEKDDRILKKICTDSRKVEKHSIFICIKGFEQDGHNFAEDAVLNGAELLIVTRKLNLKIPQILVSDARKAAAILAKLFFDDPTDKFKLIGVTGTNGKTTVTNLLYQILNFDKKVGLIGTFGFKLGDREFQTERTTPDIIELNEIFVEFVAKKVEAVIMEVSSHALALDRVFALKFDAAIFTNISQDHLDFHKDLLEYANEKAKLFQYTKENDGIQIINIDDDFGNKLFTKTTGKKISYGKKAANYKIFQIENDLHSSRFELNIAKKNYTLHSPLLGEFNIYNLTASLAACCELFPDIQVEKLMKKIPDLSPIKGRLEKIALTQKNAFIDYAHSPDALDNVLRTLHQMQPNRIITVFGAGGDRDKSKRPEMLKSALKYSEIVIVTNDNPRFESPEKIIRDILQNATSEENILIIQNRKSAIETALSLAKEKDIVLVAGKGHEEYQEINGKKLPFSDRKIIQEFTPVKNENLSIPVDPLFLEFVFGKELKPCPQLLYHISTDTRNLPKNSLFFAFKGENFDGHDFVDIVLEKGNWAVVNENYNLAHPHLIKVHDTIEAYGKLAKRYIKFFDLCSIGITGSYGKTTTKEFLANILEIDTPLIKTSANENNLIGLPKTIFKTKPEHKYGIFELGSNHFGEIEKLTAILRPDFAVITAIGASHLEFLKDINGVFQEKTAVFHHSPKKKFFPGDLSKFNEFEGITFGYSQINDYVISKVKSDQNSTRFLVNDEEYSIPTPFEKFVLNATIAIAICKEMKIPSENIFAGLQKQLSMNWRMQLKKKKARHLLIDCYNANPDSMQAALNFWKDYHPHLPHIAILGDMLELGELTKFYHKKIWSQLKKIDYDLLISVGKLAEEFQADVHYKKVEELLASQKLNELPEKAVILIKASHGISLEKILDRI